MLSRKLKPYLFPFCVIGSLAAGWLAYAPGLSGPFLFDDFPNIVNNTALHIDHLNGKTLLAAMFSSHAGILYRPLSMLSFALNSYFSGIHPYAFKVTNLCIHLSVGGALFWLSWLILTNYKKQHVTTLAVGRIKWIALAATLAWVVHPLNLTAVLYVVQRMTSLAALFTVLAMIAYLLGRQRQLAQCSGWWLIWLATPALGIIGLLCKENTALLPLYVLVIEITLFRFRTAAGRIDKSLFWYYLLGLIIPATAGIAWLAYSGRLMGGYAGRNFSPGERLLTELRVIMDYLRWIIVPNIRELGLYHDDFHISTGLLTPVTTLFSLLGLSLIVICAWLVRHRYPLVTLGIMWFFAGQLLESTILPLELVHEHRNYLPDYGILLLIFSALIPGDNAKRSENHAGLRYTISAALIIAFTATTTMRSYEWRQQFTLTYYEATHHPESSRAVYDLGRSYANLAFMHQLLDPQTAYATINRARKISNDIMPDIALILLSAKLGRPQKTEWLKDAEKKIATGPVTPQDTQALNELIKCQNSTCHFSKGDIDSLFNAAFSNPLLKPVGQTYADVATIYANYLTQLHFRLDTVIHWMKKAVEAAPKIPQYRINLAQGLTVAGDYGAAMRQIAVLKNLNRFGGLDLAISRLEKNIPAQFRYSM